MRGLLPTPYLASGAALGTTKETSDRYRPLLRTHCEKFVRGRCISADLRNTQELKGIRAEKPLRERGVIILFAEAGWGLFDRIANVFARRRYDLGCGNLQRLCHSQLRCRREECENGNGVSKQHSSYL